MSYKIRICMGGKCRMNFSQDVLKEAEKAAAQNPVLEVESRSCLCQCERGPNLEITDAQSGEILDLHTGVMPQDIEKIIKHLPVQPQQKGGREKEA